MNIGFQIVEIIASFVELFILYRICANVFNKYRKRNIESLWLAIIGTAFIQLCNQVSLFSYVTMLVFVLYTSITAKFLYNVNYISIFSVTSFYTLCLGCFDFFVLSLVSSLWNGRETIAELMLENGIARILLIIGVKIIWILIYVILEKYLYKFFKETNHAYAVLFISVIGFCGFIFLVEETCRAFKYTLVGVWLIIVIILSFFLFASYYLIMRREEKMKLNLVETHNKLLEENYTAIHKIYMDNAKTYHDMNNHLNILYQLLDNNNIENAKEYIKEIGKPITQLSKRIWTGEDVIDAVINSKILKMDSKNIPYEINVEFPQNTNILQNDMCTILANLLDNAIEGVEHLREPGKVYLTIRRINQFLMIKITNPCDANMKKFVFYPETTKENKSLHGLGLQSIKSAVDKYDGTMKCTNEDGKFTVVIMLFFNAREK